MAQFLLKNCAFYHQLCEKKYTTFKHCSWYLSFSHFRLCIRRYSFIHFPNYNPIIAFCPFSFQAPPPSPFFTLHLIFHFACLLTFHLLFLQYPWYRYTSLQFSIRVLYSENCCRLFVWWCCYGRNVENLENVCFSLI